MTASGCLQLGIFVALLLAITKPLGLHLWRALDPARAGGVNSVILPEFGSRAASLCAPFSETQIIPFLATHGLCGPALGVGISYS